MEKKKKKISVKTRTVSPKLKNKKILTPKKETDIRTPSPLKYLTAIGKRKNAIALVRLYPKGEGKLIVNSKPIDSYFPYLALQKIINQPFASAKIKSEFDITAKVRGGGVRGQAEALCLAISRAIITLMPELRKTFRASGLLTRDARVKERKKFGLKRARRAPQWKKR